MLELLEAAVAFSLTMAIVATTVTQLVDLTQSLLGTRARDLRRMLHTYAEQELGPTVQRRLTLLHARALHATDRAASHASSQLNHQRRRIIGEMNRLRRQVRADVAQANRDATLSRRFKRVWQGPVPEELQARLEDADEQLDHAIDAGAEAVYDITGDAVDDLDQLMEGLAHKEELTTLAYVSAEEFKTRLRRSRWGTMIMVELPDVAEELFEDLAGRWDKLGDDATALYRTKSRLIATAMAILLAVSVNIDSVHILRVYLADDDLRDGLVVQAEQRLAPEVRARGTVEEEVEATRQQLETLMSAGFPIGPDQFPHVCLLGDPAAQRAAGCAKRLKVCWPNDPSCQSAADLSAILGWFMGIVLTAMLAGLGGPFWYDLLSKLSSVLTQARTVSKTKS